ncbi:MAG TPA: hypothetical protein DDW84_04640 [Phycisphaerales bacterium]|nr:hypothetical protein [Phycisphaerales bacterium]
MIARMNTFRPNRGDTLDGSEVVNAKIKIIVLIYKIWYCLKDLVHNLKIQAFLLALKIMLKE